MDLIDRHVRTWMATGKKQEIDAIVAELLRGEGALLPLVKALGEFLTSEEDEQRTKGVEILALVSGNYPSEKLNRQSVKSLVTFFLGKLDDTETVIPALQGLVSLVGTLNLTASDTVNIIQSIFQHVKMKALVQAHRFKVFTIIDTLVARQRDALKGLGKEFVSGYINLAEGEKDPRNLMLAFAIARVLLIEFDVRNHIDGIFNIICCYFPITFRPPPDDPYGITPEDLKLSLRKCLTATPSFGLLAMPVFIEKLNAGSPSTKRDTLQTLNEALPIYGPSVALQYARKLWNSLKLEIFQPTDGKIEADALKTTQVLIRTIYGVPAASETEPAVEATSQEIEGLAKEACEECVRILKEPEKSQAKSATKVICAFMSTTPSVSKYTLSQAVPHFVRLFLNPDEVANRGPTLRLLVDVVVAARDSSLLGLDLPQEEVPMSPYKDGVLGVFTVGLKTAPIRRFALDGLKGLVTTRGLLSDEELGFVVHNVNEVLSENGHEDEDVSEGVLDLFSEVSSITPRHISQTTMPLLFSSLPDQAPGRTDEPERLKYWRTLAFLKRLSTQSDLFEMLVVRLSTKLDLLCAPQNSPSVSDAAATEPVAAYAHSILRTLADALAVKVDRRDPDVLKYIDRLLPQLYLLHIFGALVGADGYTVAADHRLVTVTAQIVTLIVQVQPISKQESFLVSLFAAFLEGDVKRIADGHLKLPEGRVFAPFKEGAPESQKGLTLLFASAVIALHKEVSLPVPDENAFLDALLHWSIEGTSSASLREAVSRAVSSIVNKRAEGLGNFLDDKLEEMWKSQAANPSVPAEKRRRVIVAWAQIIRALTMRGHALSGSFTDKLFELFEDAEVSWDAARALGSIVATDKVLTKCNHAVIKFLFAQKFFNSVLPRVVEGAKNQENVQRQNAYLVALASLIQPMPKSTYSHELSKLMPLLLHGLELPDADIRANVIDTFLALAADTNPNSDSNSKESRENTAISEHAASLVSTMLKNCMVSEMPNARLRIAALRYLTILPSLVRYDVLHPQKALVIRELAKVLDDPKKAVRKEAVEARTNWFKFNG